MATGRLSISRGYRPEGEAASRAEPPRLAVVVPTSPPAPPPVPFSESAVPACADYLLVHDRLTALERLARLHAAGVLSEAEFAAEKGLILALPSDELLLEAALAIPEPPRGPSLLGRLFRWKVLPLGLVAGLGLSWAAQPDATARFFADALRLILA